MPKHGTLWDQIRSFPARELARQMGFRRWHAITSIGLALCFAVADGAMLALLVPLGRGIAADDFSGFWSIPGVAWLLPQPSRSAYAFLTVAGCMFVLAILKNVVAYGQHTLTGRFQERFSRTLGQRLFARYLTFGKAYFDQNGTGRLIAVLQYRHDAAGLYRDFSTLCSTVLVLAAYLSVMVLISWRMTLFALVLFPVAHLASRSLMNSSAKAAYDSQRASEQAVVQVAAVLDAVAFYQASAQESAAMELFSETLQHAEAHSHAAYKARALNTRIQDMTALAALLIMLGFAFLIEPQSAAQGVLTLVFFFLARLSLPAIAAIPETLSGAAEKIPRARDLLTIFDDDGKYSVAGGQRTFKELRDSIRFEDLTFVYPGGSRALTDVTFRLKKGTVTALVGASGSGKSTVVQLLLRHYDVPAGKIWIDDADIRSFSIPSLRTAIAVVGQDAPIIPGTLRSNLQFGLNRSVGDAELWRVMNDSRLSGFAAQAGGLDMIIGPRGATLSGGERQRVAIARALLRKAPLLLLDEATSSLDSITEHLVQEALREALQQTTALIIAHRFSTIRRADNLIVLDRGLVAEQGSIEELLEKEGLFASMWRRQKFA